MQPPRPTKTLADYLVIAVSPVLIMGLVGSLVFFLIQVFYRGEMQGGLRWVMFWFVIAIVLVARIGIEQGPGYGSMYGLALAGATWFYLAMLFPGYLLGIILLSIVWWSANKLTWDCTLIDDDEDASGVGLLEAAAKKRQEISKDDANHLGKISRRNPDARKNKVRKGQSHAPGLWIVYFSLAALPLFGLGQALIPAQEGAERQRGFMYLFTYLSAALGLLLTTSFLGLRRYLRQRHLPMPANIAWSWMKSGVGVLAAVMVLALLIPRPGADYTWKTLAEQADHYVRTASQYATPSQPPGQGQEGPPSSRKASEGTEETTRSAAGPKEQTGQEGEGQAEAENKGPQANSEYRAPPPPPAPAGEMYLFLKRLVLWGAALWLGWWIFRERYMILQILQALWQAILQFFRDLLDIRLRPATIRKPGVGGEQAAKRRLFADYKNPFVTGKEQVCPPEQVIAYTFEAVQAWAMEQGWEPHPDQTPREVCMSLEERFPEHATGLQNLAQLYGHAAYGRQVSSETDWEPLRQLWRELTEANAIVR